jgi:ATP synthase protein I
MEEKNGTQLAKAIALTSSVLSYLVGPMLVGIFGGRWLDSWLGTSPLFLIIGLLLGIASGIYGLIRLVDHVLGEDKK